MANPKTRAQIVRQRRLRRTLLVGFLLLLLTGGAVAYMLSQQGSDTTSDDPEQATNAADAFAGGPTALLYADFSSGSELHSRDLATGEDEVLGELAPQGNTEAAPGAKWLSVETSEESEDGKVLPTIYLLDPVLGDSTELGVGIDPVWAPDGASLAWRRPVDDGECGPEGCRGDVTIVVTDPATGETSEWTEAAPYLLRGWAGEHLMVEEQDPSGDNVLYSVTEGGQLQELPLRPSDYWGASPDGKWLIQSGEASYVRFLQMEDGQISGEGEEISIPEGTLLGTGAWAHDSSRVAAFALNEAKELELVTFTPTEPDPVLISEGGETSNGVVFWAPDNNAIVFQRFTGEELEAVHCPLDATCEVILGWTTGISILRLE